MGVKSRVKQLLYCITSLIKTSIVVWLVLFLLQTIQHLTTNDARGSRNKKSVKINDDIAIINHVELTTKTPMTTTTEKVKMNRTIYHSFKTFRYIHTPTEICQQMSTNKQPYLVIVVKSSVLNIAHREAIRLTWGRANRTDICLVFLLGFNSMVKHYINYEFSLNKDIVQQDYEDNYANNTLKTIMGFDWLVKHCSKSKYVYFVDDDYFVNLPKILEYLEYHTKVKTVNLIAGYKYKDSRPIRNPSSKWFIPVEEYSNATWPPYLSGGSMIMDMDIVKMFHAEIPYTKQLFIDDVYLGIIAKSLGIELWNEGRFCITYPENRLHEIFAAHNRHTNPKVIISEWKRVLSSHRILFSKLYDEIEL